MRAVLDTNVFVSGLMVPNSTPGRILAAWRSGHFTLVLCEPLLAEIDAVLQYPKIYKRIRWDAITIERYLSLLRFEAEIVNINGASVRVPRDAKDDIVLATLVVSSADVLVTGDADLLALAASYPIITPADYVSRIF